jgi:hypothetical protein
MKLNRISMVASRLLTAWLDLAQLCGCVSRVLLLVLAVELVTMPVTQHLWQWDKFLHGGHDFELSLLMTVTCLCFVLLQADHCRQYVAFLLAIGTVLLRILGRRECARLSHAGQSAIFGDKFFSPGSFESRSLPLLI